MKRRLLKSSLTAAPSSSYNGTMAGNAKNGERLTLPTINVENEVNARTLDMLNRAQLTANLSSINEQYEQILTQLLQPYYQTLPPSMLLLNRSPVVADPAQQQQHIMRPHVSTVSCKSIPHADNPVNLEGFRHKRPIDWSMEDVWSWMVSFAEQRKISADYLNMGNFVNCTGMKLMTLSKQQFVDMDENYGEALYEEFRQLAGFDYATFDDVIRANGFSAARRRSPPAATPPYGTSFAAPPATTASYNEDAGVPSSSATALLSRQTPQQRRYASCDDANVPAAATTHCSRPSTSDGNVGAGRSMGGGGSGGGGALSSPRRHGGGSEDDEQQQQQHRMSSASTPTFRMMAAFGDKDRDSVIKTAGCDNGPIAVPGFNHNVSSALQRKLKFRQEQQQAAAAAAAAAAASTFLENFVSAGQCPSKFPYGRICKKPKPGQDDVILTASGKPRKRSQHTKGNKLWEFMRDALKDPETCPSVVKWEDPEQGVFRIVESERLARLWGKKKNNQKMTYEKLSRAMRTYYEKKILEPVPKTGLYPKKLVYKFGPCAHGWQQSSASPLSKGNGLPGHSLMPTGTNPMYFGGAGSSMDVAVAHLRSNNQPRHQSPVFINDLLMSAVAGGGSAAGCLESTAANLNLLSGSGLSNFHNVTPRTDLTSSGASDGQTAAVAAAQAAQLNFEMAAAAALIFSQFNAAAAVAAANNNSPAAAAAANNSCDESRNSRRTASVNDDATMDVGGRRCGSSSKSGGHQVVVDVKASGNNGGSEPLSSVVKEEADDEVCNDVEMETKIANNFSPPPSATSLNMDDEDQC